MEDGTQVSPATMRILYARMLRARLFEESVLRLFKEGLLHGTAHLGIGEEAAGAASAYALSEDYVFATHRGHCIAIGKGLPLKGMMAEMFGKEAGLCHGRGGSMHIADVGRNMLGANGIVGGSVALACGAALTAKKKGLDRIGAAYLGDGASNQGVTHESMNLAAAWNLPMLFLITNNRYAMSTPLSRAVRETDLAKRAYGYGMPSIELDGNDAIAVYRGVRSARAYARERGPVLLVLHTYRTSGHSKSDQNVYRSAEEIEAWRTRCPLARLRAHLLAEGLTTEEALCAMESEAEEDVREAIAYAKEAPEPDPETIRLYTYFSQEGPYA